MTTGIGYTQTIDVSSDGGTSWTPVGKVKDVDFPNEGDKVDSTTNDDGGYKAESEGLKQRSLSFPCNYDSDDAGQNMIRTADEAGTQLYWRYRPRGNVAGEREHKFYGIPKADGSTPTADMAEMTVTVMSSGVVTHSTI